MKDEHFKVFFFILTQKNIVLWIIATCYINHPIFYHVICFILMQKKKNKNIDKSKIIVIHFSFSFLSFFFFFFLDCNVKQLLYIFCEFLYQTKKKKNYQKNVVIRTQYLSHKLNQTTYYSYWTNTSKKMNVYVQKIEHLHV